ncbi:MAG: c-type cytochrome [Betaproteobacteria bacterium]|nr:c-type cytochrome [Betaproteobacteria bacterium]
MIDLAALVRFAHIAAVASLAGSFVFMTFVARRALRHAYESQTLNKCCLDWHSRIAWWSLLVALVTALLGLWLQATAIAGAAPDGGAESGRQSIGVIVLPLLAHTLYGNVWLARMLVALVIVVSLLRQAKIRAVSDDRLSIGLGLSAVLLASIALAGHAAAGEGLELVFQSVADILHLLAAGAWLGALLPLALLLRRCAAAPGVAASIVRQITSRFSMLGVICVSTLIATGGINAWLLVGGVPQLLGTPYGHLLLIKVSLLAPMLGVAAVNLLRINPAIAGDSSDQAGVMPGLAAKLSRNAWIEAALGFMILAIVGYLGTTPPGRHIQPDWPFSFRWDWALLDSAPKARAEVEAGLAWGLLGLFILQFAFLSRRYRPWTASIGAALFIYAASVVLTRLTTDAYPTTYRRPAVAYQAISIANGKQLYGQYCAACHGVQGYGDGPAGEGLRPRPADLSGRHANAHTVGDLFWWLSNGKPDTAMQGFGESLAEDERWDLINFVRAQAAARRARSLAPIIEDRPWLVAPDFAYATASGESKTLRDSRGESLVLLVLVDGKNVAERLGQLDSFAVRAGIAGLRIVVVPRDAQSARPVTQLPWVIEGNAEIHQTYALFATSFSKETPRIGARHVEYLIDKRGYIRARWLPGEGEAWRDPTAIAVQAELLSKEISPAPAPEEHVH